MVDTFDAKRFGPSTFYFVGLAAVALGMNVTILKTTGEVPVAASQYRAPVRPLVEPISLHFGTVEETDAFEWQLTLRNHSDRTVSVRRFSAACECTLIEPENLRILPGRTGSITMNLDLSALLPQARAIREYRTNIGAKISFEGSPDEHAVQWQVRGYVENLLSLERAPLSVVTRDKAGDEPDAALIAEVDFRSCRELVSVDVGIDSADLANIAGLLEVQRSMTDPHGGVLRLVRTGDLPRGRHTATLLVCPLDAPGKMLPQTSVPVLLDVRGSCHAVPAVVFLGTVSVGEPRKCTVTLLSEAESSYRLEKWAADSDVVEIRDMSRESGGGRYGQEFEVTIAAMAKGAFHHEVTLDLIGDSGRAESVSFAIAGIAHATPDLGG